MPGCLRLPGKDYKYKSKGRFNKESGGRGRPNSLHLPLKPVKFPQSSREPLKEGMEVLKNRSVPLDGLWTVSVNRFICSRVLIR